MDANLIIFIFFLLAFVSELVGTISGFGSSVFFVPLAGILFDFETTLVLTSITFIFSSSIKVIMFRKEIDWSLMWKIGIPSVLLTLLGAALNNRLNTGILELIMGVFLIAFSMIYFILGNEKLQVKPNNFNVVSGGSISGFFNGLIGTGGAIRGATLALFGLSKNVFVGTSAGIDLGGDISRTVVYVSQGYLENKYYWFIPILLGVTYVGVFIGKKVLNKISKLIFQKILLAIIFVTGALMIYSFISGKEIIL